MKHTLAKSVRVVQPPGTNPKLECHFRFPIDVLSSAALPFGHPHTPDE